MVVGSLDIQTDLLVIGAGPGGYVAAIRAAQNGKEVTVVDTDGELGGVCLHHGCIPTKTYIHSTDFGHVIDELEQCGVEVDDYSVNFSKIHDHKDDVVQTLSNGIDHLFDKHGIELIKGYAEFTDDETVHVRGQSDVTSITFNEAIISTGSKPIELPFMSFDNERVLDSRELLQLDNVPDSLLIVGGGYIGTEMGTVFGKLGADVTIIEQTDRLIPALPEDTVDVVRDRLDTFNVITHCNTTAKAYEETNGEAVVTVESDGARRDLTADYVLVVVGREPNTQGVNLDEVGLGIDERGFIPVNKHMQTRQDNIYAIGDVTGQPLLAHKAVRQGKVAAEHITTGDAAYENKVIPKVVFNDPEIACVGLTAEQAREQGFTVKQGTFDFKASGRAHTLSKPTGFVRVVADADTHRVLGVQSVGPQVSGMIGEATLAIELDASLDDLATTIHTHPTIPEGLMAAAEDALDKAIHD
jgi:dihydrolipoamide dehydrogenase